MSNTTFTISTGYLLSAIKKDGSRVYYDTDAHSGGYPYWSSYSVQAKKFKDLATIPTLKNDEYMRTDVVRIEVLIVELRATIVESTELVSDAKAKAMAEIDKIQKELARKIATLEGM
jgi:hypothetical protein